MTTQTPDAVREAIIAAITKADANFGYSYRLTKMDETGEEHTLFMDGFEPVVFQDREDGYPVIEQRRNAARTDAILAIPAILAALDSRAGDAGEGRWHECATLLVNVLAADPGPKAAAAFAAARRWWDEYDASLTATPAPAVDAVPAGEVLKQQAHEWRRREVQAIGAAISTRSWHAVEQAYNSLRDKMDAAGCWHAPAALSHGEGRK